MEKRITRAVTSSQKETQVVLIDKSGLLHLNLDMDYFNIFYWKLQGLGASRCNRVKCYLNQELSLYSIGRLDMPSF